MKPRKYTLHGRRVRKPHLAAQGASTGACFCRGAAGAGGEAPGEGFWAHTSRTKALNMKIYLGTLNHNVPGRQKQRALKKHFQSPGYITEREAAFRPKIV